MADRLFNRSFRILHLTINSLPRYTLRFEVFDARVLLGKVSGDFNFSCVIGGSVVPQNQFVVGVGLGLD
jgi:hypothetical protein